MPIRRSSDEQIAEDSAQFVSAASLRSRSAWLIKLRWAAGLGELALSFVAIRLGGIPLSLTPLLALGLLLLGLNAVWTLRNARTPPSDIFAELRLVRLQMVTDLLLLTAVLHFSGGVENPFQYIYVIHVIIASLLFKGRQVFHIAWLAILLYTALIAGEHFGLLPHHHLLSADELTHGLPFTLMSLAAMWLALLTSAWIGAAIMHHNRLIKDELVERQGELTQAAEAKLDFFRFVTHEIKSPVATAQSAIEAARELTGDELPSPTRDLLDRAVKRLSQALDIVKDLADLTRGRMTGMPDFRPVDLSTIVRQVLEQQAETLATERQELSADLPPQPLVVPGDEGMLEKIVVNLVGNAIRYNRRGGRVTVELADLGGAVRLAITDEGIGIPSAEQEYVFAEFYRTAEAREVSDAGTGLGLTIVRRFVQQLDGVVRLRSEVGRGSTFVVELPKLEPGGGRW